MNTLVQDVQVAASSDEQEACPECQGAVREDGAERVCDACGLVLEEGEIDHGPEWRAFDAREKNERSRVGAPRTERRHDKGLGSEISWEKGEGSKMSRLRWQDRRGKLGSKKDRNQAHGLAQVRQLCGRLEVTGSIVDRACRIWSEAHDANLALGRTIDVVVAGAVLAAAREQHVPVTLPQLLETVDVDRGLLVRVYHDIHGETSAETTLLEPVEHVDRIASGVDLSEAARRDARDITIELQEAGLHSGRDPSGVAAGAVYVAAWRHGRQATQPEVAEVADVSTPTIRDRRDEILDAGLVEPQEVSDGD